MIVAGVALIVALAGTAMAAPTAIKAVLDKKEKKQVKNIANKQINKRAPGLSVANANTVGGFSAAALQTSSGFNQDANVTNLTTTFTNVATATITTRSTGRILATASAELDDGNGTDEGVCDIIIDGEDSFNYETSPDDITPPNAAVVAVNFAVTRPAGTYTASIRCAEVGASVLTKDDAAINLYGLGA
jgi:hypothetical protein